MSAVEDLKFFSERVELAGPDGSRNLRARDRTVAVIRRYLDVSAALKRDRLETMSCLEARPGKGDSVTLVVADKSRFDSIREAISGNEELFKALEGAITKLDELAGDGELWYSDIETSVGSLGSVESNENRRLANLGSNVLARRVNSGKPVDQVLAEDPEYQRFSRIAVEQIENANRRLEVLRPQLDTMKALLEGVGC